MSNELNCVFDYNTLDYKCIISLLKHMNNRNISNEKRKNLVVILINKYFSVGKTFDLYSFLNQLTVRLDVAERLTMGCNLLMMELIKTSDVELRDEFKEPFFRFLLSFLEFVDKLSGKTENEIEITFDFTSMPKLIDYLSDANKLNITSASLRANLNVLVEKIKKNLEEKSKIEEEKGLVPVNDVENLRILEVSKKVEEIKELKLIKSQLTQSKLEGIMTEFKLYSHKDKVYIIDFLMKKKWNYLLFKIPSLDAFDFLVSNLEYQNICKNFNLLHIFSSSFRSNYNYLEKWKKYFKVDSLMDVFDEFKSLYLKLAGDTSVNFKEYFNSIVKNTLEYKGYFDTATTSEFVEYWRNKLLLDFDADVTSLINVSKFTLFDWLNEKLPFENEDICLLEYYFRVISKYVGFFFDYYAFNTDAYSIKFAECVSDAAKEQITEFVNLIGKVTFTGDMLVEVTNKFDLKNFISMDDRDLSAYVNEFIRIYFCYHYNDRGEFLDVKWVKNIVCDSDNLKTFYELVDKISYQGAFNSRQSYAFCFFEILLESLDFSKPEDFNVIYVLGLDYLPSNKKTLELVLSKLKTDNALCYSLLLDYTENNIMDRSEGVFAFLKTYYGLE